MPSPNPTISIPMETEIATLEAATQILTDAFNQAVLVNYEATRLGELRRQHDRILNQIGKGLNLLKALYETDEYDKNYSKVALFFERAARKLFQRGKQLKLNIDTRTEALSFFKLAGTYYENYVAHCENKYIKVTSYYHCLRLSAYVNIIDIHSDTERGSKYKTKYVTYFEKNLADATDIAECYRQTYLEYSKLNIKPSSSGNNVTIPDNPNHELLGRFTLKRPILKLQFIENSVKPFPPILVVNTNTSVENIKSLFMSAIKSFVISNEKILNNDQGHHMSHIILYLAQTYSNDPSFSWFFQSSLTKLKEIQSKVALTFVAQSVYEAAAALSNQRASADLNKFRLENVKPLASSNFLRVSAEFRASLKAIPVGNDELLTQLLQQMHKEIDDENLSIASSRIDQSDPKAYSNHLEKFFEEHLDELEILFPEHFKKILEHIAFKLGDGFKNNQIIVGDGFDSAAMADLFLKQVLALQNLTVISTPNDLDEQPIKKLRI